jgi:hypothetical protein
MRNHDRDRQASRRSLLDADDEIAIRQDLTLVALAAARPPIG